MHFPMLSQLEVSRSLMGRLRIAAGTERYRIHTYAESGGAAVAAQRPSRSMGTSTAPVSFHKAEL